MTAKATAHSHSSRRALRGLRSSLAKRLGNAFRPDLYLSPQSCRQRSGDVQICASREGRRRACQGEPELRKSTGRCSRSSALVAARLHSSLVWWQTPCHTAGNFRSSAQVLWGVGTGRALRRNTAAGVQSSEAGWPRETQVLRQLVVRVQQLRRWHRRPLLLPRSSENGSLRLLTRSVKSPHVTADSSSKMYRRA